MLKGSCWAGVIRAPHSAASLLAQARTGSTAQGSEPWESLYLETLQRLGQLFTPTRSVLLSLANETHSCQLLTVNASISYR